MRPNPGSFGSRNPALKTGCGLGYFSPACVWLFEKKADFQKNAPRAHIAALLQRHCVLFFLCVLQPQTRPSGVLVLRPSWPWGFAVVLGRKTQHPSFYWVAHSDMSNSPPPPKKKCNPISNLARAWNGLEWSLCLFNALRWGETDSQLF